MASLVQGAPLPDITQTTTTASTAPKYYTDYLTGLSKAGDTALGRTAEQGVAAYDPMQTKGYGAIEDASTAYKSGLSDAENTAKLAAAGIDPQRIKDLLNPYTQNVTDEMARLSQQNVQRNVLPSLKAGFVGTGGLGSSRYAGALGQSMADIQSSLTGQQYGALSAGYNKALDAALQELQQQNQAAQTQAMIAQKEQELGLTGAQAMIKGGAEQQAYEQSKLDYPLRTATTVSNLMRGYQVPMDQTQTFKGPKAGMYQQSPLEIALGLGSFVGSGAAGKAGSTLKDWWTSIFGKPAAPGPGEQLKVGETKDDLTYAGVNSNGQHVWYNPATGGYVDASGFPVDLGED